MKKVERKWQALLILGMMFLLPDSVFAQTGTEHLDSLSFSHGFIHRIEAEARPGYILPTQAFLRGENEQMQPIENALSAHLKYAFHSYPGTVADRIYGGAYQGLGLGWFTFGEPEHLGSPLALYLFQGARIARLAPQLTLNYEWNFGLSFGWKPYHPDLNPYNKVIGSKTNAYLNTNFYLSWMLSPQFDFTAGIDLSHFSNGNTQFPNAGLNTLGAKVGLIYNFNRNERACRQPLYLPYIPPFPRHISYDLVLFGSWRRKGVAVGDEQYAAPGRYTVAGFSFAPMYNVGYKFRTGIAADVVYDGSANLYAPPYILGTMPTFEQPSFEEQLAFGLSARFEYVMPYFTVGLGIGTNVLHAGGDLKSCYQILALKINVSRNSFLHIGYNLHNFHTPNYLMLGVGFRFHNLYPEITR